jgi:tetratricopeptide (TPR) repeat protein
MRLTWGAGLLLLACAKAPPAPAPPVFPAEAVGTADARLDEGCYTCLLDARDRYARLADGPFRSALLPRLFEAQLLIVLREKELAMPFAPSLAAAQRLGEELPASFEASRYLAIVEALPEDVAGTSAREQAAFAGAHLEFVSRAPAELSWLERGALRPIVGQYLSTAMRCVDAWFPRDRRAGAASGSDRIPEDEPPLLTYRSGICSTLPNRARLEVARTVVPEFHEAGYFLGRSWLLMPTTFGLVRPANAIAEAYAHFPQSSSMAYTSGAVAQMRNRCLDALARYAETLLLRPDHENAALGRVMCLSHLGRPDEAILEATALIGLGGDTQPFGYYWRAWNQHKLKALALAREDIEAAKRLASSAEFLLLAGIIAYDQDDLPPALIDLPRAITLSRGRACTASWYLALVHLRKQVWKESAAAFEQAMACYAFHVRDARERIEVLERITDMDPEFRAQELRSSQASVLENEAQRLASAINAAKNYANAGQYEPAVRLGMIAMEDPALGPEIEVLRDFLAARKSPVQLPPDRRLQ